MVRGDKAGALGDRDQRAEIVEEIDEEEDEDNLEQSLGECAANVELECCFGQFEEAAGRRSPVNQTDRPRDCGQLSTPMRIEPRTFFTSRRDHQHETEQRERRRRIR